MLDPTLSETDVRKRFIDKDIAKSNWDDEQITTERYITKGKVEKHGDKVKRAPGKKPDYILYYKPNYPIAVVEAKDQTHGLGDGLQQAMDYAMILNVPFAYSSNGTGFVEHDFTTGIETELGRDDFPSPQDLWQRYKKAEKITDEQEKIIEEPYYYRPGYYKPRYYQRIAINQTIKAISQGKQRILLVMATGTGKTFTAFQIAHRLYESGMKKKILYLADRNILIDQTMDNDFKPFEGVMTKISGGDIETSYEIFFGLYQQLYKHNALTQPYEKVQKDFFDLIIVDECHRGSASEDSEWRAILEYFSSATQIGMTATPKETKKVSNTLYFGEPLYEYTLKQGIEDGFLAPYQVYRIDFDVDLEGYRPGPNKKDDLGNPLEDKEYTRHDFDRNIVLLDRNKKVAKKITEFLKKTNRFDKTIVFCVDIDHAERMRRLLVNENAELVKDNPKYVMKITGDDKIGKDHLDYFIDEDEKYPTIVTTSKLLSTGVDCKTCKLIVLDNNIESMTEFKQIIGRGTRIKEEYDKLFFTILDFRNNTLKFEDPEFDGEPLVVYGGDKTSGKNTPESLTVEHTKKHKPIIKDVTVKIVNERRQVYDKDGKLITENFIDYSRKNIMGEYTTLEHFIKHWNSLEKKEAINKQLEEYNVFLDDLREEVGNDEIDDFDLICHIAYDQKPLTRQQRADKLRNKKYLDKYSGIAKSVMDALLDKYATGGITNLESTEIFNTQPFKQIGSPMKIAKDFGGKQGLLDAMTDLRNELYS
ncbi:MAG: DEAD/DEAH box helicase [Methanosphaera stadtmanae]|nr:DEAD/DEAH box helicase [Methanosphaera stadtmanae]